MARLPHRAKGAVGAGAGDERERDVARRVERRLAKERAASLRLLVGGWLRGRSPL
jgi:hypothetical protein